jgi:hypothetical protein
MSDIVFPLYLNRTNVPNKRPAPIVLADEVDGVHVQAWTPSSLFGNFALKGEGWAASFDIYRDGTLRLVSGSGPRLKGHWDAIWGFASEAFRRIHGGPAPLLSWEVYNGRTDEMIVLAAQPA